MKINKILFFTPIIGLLYGLIDGYKRGFNTEITNISRMELKIASSIQGLSIGLPLGVFIFKFLTQGV